MTRSSLTIRGVITAAILSLFIGFNSQSAQADLIKYRAESELALFSGPDIVGLDGATFVYEAVFTISPYEDRFGFPSILADSSTGQLIGSTIPGNDGTYQLGDTAFYPTFAGIYGDPSGLNDISIFLNGSGIEALFGLETVPTVDGSNAVIGGIPIVSDFAPTTIVGVANSTSRFVIDGVAVYDFVNTSVTAVKIPEPHGFFALALLATMATRRAPRISNA